MLTFLEHAVDKSCIDGLGDEFETIVALDQPEYSPIRVIHYNNRTVVRFTMTNEQREAVKNGADLFFITLGHIPPMKIALSQEPTLQDAKAIFFG